MEQCQKNNDTYIKRRPYDTGIHTQRINPRHREVLDGTQSFQNTILAVHLMSNGANDCSGGFLPENVARAAVGGSTEGTRKGDMNCQILQSRENGRVLDTQTTARQPRVKDIPIENLEQSTD